METKVWVYTAMAGVNEIQMEEYRMDDPSVELNSDQIPNFIDGFIGTYEQASVRLGELAEQRRLELEAEAAALADEDDIEDDYLAPSNDDDSLE